MKILEKIWTSDLHISCDDESIIDDELVAEVSRSIAWIEKLLPSKHGGFSPTKDRSVKQLCEMVVGLDGSKKFTIDDLLDFVNYDVPQDFTGVMKGIAIQMITNALVSKKAKSFTISFGSDIMTVNRPVTLVSKYDPKLRITIENGCAFTSGNDDFERGQHIKMYDSNPFNVVHVIDDTEYKPVFCDFAATWLYSHVSQAQRWPHLKVIGVQSGSSSLLCDGNVPIEDPEDGPSIEKDSSEGEKTNE
jgi:hypothetical protein